MVLEAVANINKKLSKPHEMFYVGVLFASIATIMAIWTFKSSPSLIAVFFTVMIGIPFIYNLLKFEENREVKLKNESEILRAHKKPMLMYFYMFLGITLAFFLWQTILPNAGLGDFQIHTIQQINSVSGKVHEYFGGADVTGNFLRSDFPTFMKIFSNNMRVMVFSLVFSMVFGVGALFILVWNSSVLATAFTHFYQKYLAAYGLFGYNNIKSVIFAFSQSSLRYLVHGIPEIAAYLVAGFAGGILSASIINGHYKTHFFDKVLYDFVVLVTISVGLILGSGILEVFIMPQFF